MSPEKQHPNSVNRDLDDEVAEAIEHQYAGKLVKQTGKAAGRNADTDTDTVEAAIDQLRKKSRP